MDLGKFVACVAFSGFIWLLQEEVAGKMTDFKWKAQFKFVFLVAGIAFAYAVGYDQGVKGE